MKVATGLAVGREANPALVHEAVAKAMQSAKISCANSVLLFLTSEFARDPEPALRAASKAASCTQMMGCSAPGIFTEQDWIVDAPAAAAMVFGGDAGLQSASRTNSRELLMALAAPNAMNITWMAEPGVRFGGVSGDAIGQGPFSVWQNGKGTASGHCEASLKGIRGRVAAAHGVRMLSVPQVVTAVNGHDLLQLDGQSALLSLQQACGKEESLALHRLMAAIADSAEAVKKRNYRFAALVCGNEADGSVTLAKYLTPGQYLCWVVREPQAAQQDFKDTLLKLEKRLGIKPDFGLLFSCLGRGPYFYGGMDRDLELLCKQFPQMPLIGFYGNGEIAPMNGVNELLQYSAVLGLFTCEPEIQP